jgi:hypothetical protein
MMAPPAVRNPAAKDVPPFCSSISFSTVPALSLSRLRLVAAAWKSG